MKLGAEPKKVAILGGLLAVGGYVLYSNLFSGDSAPPPARRPAAAVVSAPVSPSAAVTPAPGAEPAAPPRRRDTSSNTAGEFKIRQGVARPEDRPDPSTIDPTIRLDLLAKIQSVEAEGAARNLFKYGAAPPPPSAKLPELPKDVGKIAVKDKPADALPPPTPGPPPTPKAPPMTFKYYGFKVSKMDGRKEAFLLDGEEIIIAGENESVKRGRYRVVKIGLSSITIEDTQFKSNQTLPLQEEPTA